MGALPTAERRFFFESSHPIEGREAQTGVRVPLYSHETYMFSDKKLQTWENGLGHAWVYTYNVDGSLSRVTDGATGRYLALGYNQGRIAFVSDHAGRVVSFGYSYSAAGDLETASNLGRRG